MDESDIDEGLVRESVAGLELQIIELVEQQKRAEDEGRGQDADQLRNDVNALHLTLAQVAEIVASAGDPDHPADVQILETATESRTVPEEIED
ncbi:MAG: hypothetical protein ACRDZ3_17775 [Acidimicrobiia bacterium]